MRKSYDGGVVGTTDPLAVEKHYERMEAAVKNLHPDAFDLTRDEAVKTVTDQGEPRWKMKVRFTLLDIELTYHFTYGTNHGHGKNKYTTIVGVDDDTARNIQFALHGNQWAFQYPDDKHWADTVTRFNMKEIEKVTVETHNE